jgi:hypothetical protein
MVVAPTIHPNHRNAQSIVCPNTCAVDRVPQISTELPATREVLKKSRRVVFIMSVPFLNSSYRLGLFCAARKIDRTRVQAKANRIEPVSAGSGNRQVLCNRPAPGVVCHRN